MVTPDDRDLDTAFELSDVVEDIRMRELYEVLVQRMRNEVRHLPMNTLQQLQIERICYNYIVLKLKERGELGGFDTTNQQKEFNTFWLSMTTELNRTLGKVEPMSGADRKALLREVQHVIVETVSTVPDPRVRSELLEKMASAFAKAGM